MVARKVRSEEAFLTAWSSHLTSNHSVFHKRGNRKWNSEETVLGVVSLSRRGQESFHRPVLWLLEMLEVMLLSLLRVSATSVNS